MESSRARPGLFDLFSPERVGIKFERLIALALLAVALTATFAPVIQARSAATKPAATARTSDDMDHELVQMAELAKKDPHHPLLLAFGAWVLLGTGLALLLQIRLGRRAQANPGKPLFPEDPTRAAPAWGLADFGLVLFVQQVIGVACLAAVPGPLLHVEGGRTIELRQEKRVSFGGVAGAGSTTAALAVPGATAERAAIERGSTGFVLHAFENERLAPAVSVNGKALVAGERSLAPGDAIAIGAVRAKYEAPSLAFLYSLNAFADLLVIGFIVLVVLRRGGRVRDLGLTGEGALGESFRGVTGYLAAVPAILIAMIASSALCRALGVPFEAHPLLKSLETEHGFATVATLFLLAAVVAPLQEEVLFRGFLLRALRRPYPSRIAATLIVSFFFGSLHPGLASVLPITLVGSVFSAIFLTSKRGSLVGAIVAHVSFNAVNIAFELAVLHAR